MYLLDTCVLSEGIRPRPNENVDRWFSSQDTEALFVSAITAGELRYGIDRLQAGRKRETLEQWFMKAITVGFAGRILAFDFSAASHWARIRSSHPNAGTVDSQIAATAIVNGFALVTRNVKDFAFSGLSVFNPWNG